MTRKLGCPSSAVLVDLIQGQMVEPELSALSVHLEECTDCQTKARTLSVPDVLIDSLRGAAPVEDRIAQEVPRLLVERLKQIPRREATTGAEQEPDFLGPTQEADEIGRLGPYRILKCLGRGGMGAVYLAEDPRLERRVALKVMLPRIAANPNAKDRFLREARVAAKVKSDCIVTIHQVDEANGVPYLAMELLEGASLADVLRTRGPLSAAQVIAVARDIARGLAAAHEKGLIHRDIKPGNLWLEGTLDGGGRVKILDFGLARAEQDDAHITQSGTIVGTPAYMAPEQARGEKTVDARADLFSLGCVLYRLCTGNVPFMSESTMGTLMAVALRDPIPLSQVSASIPRQLCELIMQLLEKDPNRRPQSAREVIGRLAEIERSLLPAADGPPRKRRSRMLAIAGVLCIGLVILAGGIFYWQTSEGKVVRVECDDPSIKVAFEDGELKVTGAYKEPLVLKPGKVGLTVVRGDFKFETDKLIVNKGDRIALRIEVVEGKVQVVQDGKGVLDSRALPVPPVPSAVVGDSLTVAEILTSTAYEWTEPKDLGNVVNFGQNHDHPFVSADGLELWYGASTGKGDEQGVELWVARRKSLAAPWEAPTRLGASINSEVSEKYPILTANGLRLMFWRYPMYRLFEANRTTKDAAWSEPVMLKDSLNCTSPVLSANGLELHVSRLGKVHRAARPSRNAEWSRFAPVKELAGEGWLDPCWLSEDDRWLLLSSVDKGKGKWWMSQRASPLQPWGGLKQLDAPTGFTKQRRPSLVRAPDGLEVYFSKDNRLHVGRRVLKAGK